MARDNDLVARICGPGWDPLIRPIVQMVNEADGMIEEIIEHNGRLRITYVPGNEWDDSIQQAIDDAEKKSAVTCELCGVAGGLMFARGYYKVLCAEHARELDFTENA